MVVWPTAEDITQVEAMYVFAWDVQLTSRNGRTWSVVELEDLEQSYQLYKETY